MPRTKEDSDAHQSAGTTSNYNEEEFMSADSYSPIYFDQRLVDVVSYIYPWSRIPVTLCVKEKRKRRRRGDKGKKK